MLLGVASHRQVIPGLCPVRADRLLILMSLAPQGALCRPATAISLAVAAALTAVMFRHWQATNKFMPAGIVAALSGAMVVFYVWNMVFIGPPQRPAARSQ